MREVLFSGKLVGETGGCSNKRRCESDFPFRINWSVERLKRQLPSIQQFPIKGIIF